MELSRHCRMTLSNPIIFNHCQLISYWCLVFFPFSFAEEWRQRRRRSSGRIGIGRRGWRRRRCCGATDRRLQPGRRWVERAETAQGRADTKASRPATTETAAAGISHFLLLLPLKRADWHFRSRQSCGNGSRWNWRCDPSCWSPIPTATSIIWMRWCRWLAKSTTRSSRHSSVRCIIDLQVEIPERSGRDCRQDKKKKEEEFARAWEIPWRFRATATLIQKIPLVDSGSWSWVEQKQQQNGEENKRNRNEKKKSFFFLWHFLVYLLALSGTSLFFFFFYHGAPLKFKNFKFKFNAELVFTIIMMMISSLPWGSLWLRGVASSSSPLRNTMESRHNKPPHFPSRSCPGRPDVSHPLGIPP